MNTFADRLDLGSILNPARPLLDAPALTKRHQAGTLEPPHIESGNNRASIGSHSVTRWPIWLGRKKESRPTLSFPLAFSAFIALLTGAIAFCFGCFAANVWLAVTGTLLITFGGALYGWSLDG